VVAVAVVVVVLVVLVPVVDCCVVGFEVVIGHRIRVGWLGGAPGLDSRREI
jgi:hypothetical protein